MFHSIVTISIMCLITSLPFIDKTTILISFLLYYYIYLHQQTNQIIDLMFVGHSIYLLAHVLHSVISVLVMMLSLIFGDRRLVFRWYRSRLLYGLRFCISWGGRGCCLVSRRRSLVFGVSLSWSLSILSHSLSISSMIHDEFAFTGVKQLGTDTGSFIRF